MTPQDWKRARSEGREYADSALQSLEVPRFTLLVLDASIKLLRQIPNFKQTAATTVREQGPSLGWVRSEREAPGLWGLRGFYRPFASSQVRG
jgi:hypothetical protein